MTIKSITGDSSISIIYQSQIDEYYCFCIILNRSPFFAKQNVYFDKKSMEYFLQKIIPLQSNYIGIHSISSIDRDFSIRIEISNKQLSLNTFFFSGECGYLESFFDIDCKSISCLINYFKDVLSSNSHSSSLLDINATSSTSVYISDSIVQFNSSGKSTFIISKQNNSYYITFENSAFSFSSQVNINNKSLLSFKDNLNAIYNHNLIEESIKLHTVDNTLCLSIVSDISMHIYATLSIKSDNYGSLTTSFDFDQTFIPDITEQLSNILS